MRGMQLTLIIGDELQKNLDKKLISAADLKEAIWLAESSGDKFYDESDGMCVASMIKPVITYWVQYRETAPLTLRGIQRLLPPHALRAGGVIAVDAEARIWKCGTCDRELVMKKAVLEYLGQTVSHEVPTCPKCGKVYICEELAEGRMSEVEQLLEDK